MNYVLAVDRKEAEELNREGFGYETKLLAEIALSNPELDDYYRSKLKIFALKPVAQPEADGHDSAARPGMEDAEHEGSSQPRTATGCETEADNALRSSGGTLAHRQIGRPRELRA